MKTKTISLYEFDELSPYAKERAREWWRECEAQDFGNYNDFNEPIETAAKILGITFKTRPVPLMSGKTRYESKVWWTLHTQGAGASYDATYSYAKGSCKAIRAEFPTDTKLHAIADGLRDIERKYRYRITANIAADHRGHWMMIEYDAGISREDEETMYGLFRSFARWIFDYINAEWDYCMSDENVDGVIRANEYMFTVNGKREDME